MLPAHAMRTLGNGERRWSSSAARGGSSLTLLTIWQDRRVTVDASLFTIKSLVHDRTHAPNGDFVACSRVPQPEGAT